MFIPHTNLFVPPGLRDGGRLDDRLVTAFDENPVAGWHSVHFNLVSINISRGNKT